MSDEQNERESITNKEVNVENKEQSKTESYVRSNVNSIIVSPAQVSASPTQKNLLESSVELTKLQKANDNNAVANSQNNKSTNSSDSVNKDNNISSVNNNHVWTDVQLLRYALRHSLQATDANEMVDASQSFALIYKVLARKCAVVEDLVQSAIFHIERNDKAITEGTTKSTSASVMNINATNTTITGNNNSNNKDNREEDVSLKNKESHIMLTTQGEDDKIKNNADKTSNSTHINSSFPFEVGSKSNEQAHNVNSKSTVTGIDPLSMMLLPPGLDDEDYAQERLGQSVPSLSLNKSSLEATMMQTAEHNAQSNPITANESSRVLSHYTSTQMHANDVQPYFWLIATLRKVNLDALPLSTLEEQCKLPLEQLIRNFNEYVQCTARASRVSEHNNEPIVSNIYTYAVNKTSDVNHIDNADTNTTESKHNLHLEENNKHNQINNNNNNNDDVDGGTDSDGKAIATINTKIDVNEGGSPYTCDTLTAGSPLRPRAVIDSFMPSLKTTTRTTITPFSSSSSELADLSRNERMSMRSSEAMSTLPRAESTPNIRKGQWRAENDEFSKSNHHGGNDNNYKLESTRVKALRFSLTLMFATLLWNVSCTLWQAGFMEDAYEWLLLSDTKRLSLLIENIIHEEYKEELEEALHFNRGNTSAGNDNYPNSNQNVRCDNQDEEHHSPNHHDNNECIITNETSSSNTSHVSLSSSPLSLSSPPSPHPSPAWSIGQETLKHEYLYKLQWRALLSNEYISSINSELKTSKHITNLPIEHSPIVTVPFDSTSTNHPSSSFSSSSPFASPLPEMTPLRYEARYLPTRKASTYCQRLFHDIISLRDLCALIIHCHTAEDVVCLMAALSTALTDFEQKRTELATLQVNKARSMTDENKNSNNINIAKKENNNVVINTEEATQTATQKNNNIDTATSITSTTGGDDSVKKEKQTGEHVKNDTEEEDCVAEMILFLNITVEFFLSKRAHKLYEEHMAEREREMKLLEHSDTFTRQFNSIVYKEEETNRASPFATNTSSKHNINIKNSNVNNSNNKKNLSNGSEIIDNTVKSQKQFVSSRHSDNNTNVSSDKNENHSSSDANDNEEKYYQEYMNKMMRLACNELVCECTNGVFNTLAELDEHGLPSAEEAPELLAPGILYVLCVNVLGSVMNFVNLYSVSRIYRSVALTETYHVNRTFPVYHDTTMKRIPSQSTSRSDSVNLSSEAQTNTSTKENNQISKNRAVPAEKAHRQNNEANANATVPGAPHISFGDRLISFFTGVTNQSNISTQIETQSTHRQQFTSSSPPETKETFESEHKSSSTSTITSDNHTSTTNTSTSSNNNKPLKVIGKNLMQHESPRSSSCSQSELQQQQQQQQQEQLKQLGTLQLTQRRTHHPFILTHTGRELLLPSMHHKNGLLLLAEEKMTFEPHRYTRSRETRTLSELDTRTVQHNTIKDTNRELQKADFTSHPSTVVACDNNNTNSIICRSEKKYNSYTTQSGNVNEESESNKETQELSLRLLTLFYRYRHIHRVEYIDTNVLCTVIQELNKAIYILRNKLRIHLGWSWWTGWKHTHDVQMTNFYTKLVNEVSHIKRMYKSTLSDAGQYLSANVAWPEHTSRNMTQRLHTTNDKQGEIDHEAITCTRTHSPSSSPMAQTVKEQSMGDNSSVCHSSKRVCHAHNATLLPPSMPDPYASSFPANKYYNNNINDNNKYDSSKISVIRERGSLLLSEPNKYTLTTAVTATHGDSEESRNTTRIRNNDINTSKSDSSLLQCSVMTDQEVHKNKVAAIEKNNSNNMSELKSNLEEQHLKNEERREEMAHKEWHSTIQSEKPLSSWWKQKVSVPSAAQLYKRREEGEKSNWSNKMTSEDNQLNKTTEEVSTHSTNANNYKHSNSTSKSGNSNNISVTSTTDKDQDKGAQRGESKLISTLHSAMTSVQMMHRKSINNESKEENLLKQRQGSSMVEPSIAWDVPPRFIPYITIDFSVFTTSTLETQLATQQMVHEMIERQAQEQARLKIANMESSMMDEGNNNNNTNKSKSNHSQMELVNDNTTGISILSAYSRQLLHDELPILQQYANWRIIYSSYVHGVSLNTLFTNCEREEADYQERHRYTSKRTMNWHEQQQQQQQLHGSKNRKDCNELPSRPMLLVMELVPSTTYSFAADGQGVREAKKVLVEELQKQKNLEKKEQQQQHQSEYKLSKAKNMNEIYIQKMEHRVVETQKDSHECENDKSSNERSEEKHKIDVHEFKDKHPSNVHTGINETKEINACANDTHEHVNENKAKVNKMIIGAYLSHLLHRNTRRYYGSGETFVFQIFQSAGHGQSTGNTLPQLHTFHSSGANQQFINCRRNSIVIGGGGLGSSIYIDDTLYHGATAPCATFTCSPPLTEWQPDADNNDNSNMIDNSHSKYYHTNKFNLPEENVSISDKDELNVNDESQFSLNDSNNVSNSSSGISTSFDILHL